MLPPAIDRRRDSILASVLILLAAFVVFAGVRAHEQYQQGVDIATLKVRVDGLRKDVQIQTEFYKEKFDQIDQTLYPNAVAIKALKSTTRRPSSIEVWQLERDRELRASIDEGRRRQTEYDRKLAEIQKQVTQLAAKMNAK